MNIEYIDTPEQLTELCHRINQEPWIALDTEFLREKTYYPIFCLLQIASPRWVACVDPIVLDDLSILFKAINQPHIVKVLHACRQDLEIFYRLTGEVTVPVFDTQMAAPLLGFQENPGYAMLVSNLLNINLAKIHTRTDWSVRPLSQDQIQYAADDVIYLCQIYPIILQKLDTLGRLDWLNDDFEHLRDPELYQISPANAWLKLRSKNKLTGKQLSIIQTLAEWRETTAQLEDRPKSWLIRDDLLLELAKFQPKSLAALAKVRGINDRTLKRYGKIIAQLIQQAVERPPIPLVKNKAAKRTQQQEAILDILTAVVRMRADNNEINPNNLASRKDLEKLLQDDQDSLVLKGWRYQMVGKELIDLLQGHHTLTLNAGKLSITKISQ